MANEDNVIVKSEVSNESVRTRHPVTTRVVDRATPFGEKVVYPLGKPKVALADEGSYFVATNATPGTAIVTIAAADGFDVLETALHLRNDNSAVSGKRIYLDYLRIKATAAGTNGTTTNYGMTVDASGATRRTSGGTAITPVNASMHSSTTSSATMYFGPIITTASTTDRLIHHAEYRSVIKVVGDTVLWDFGGEHKAMSETSSVGTAILNSCVSVPPVVLDPGDQFLLHEWAASQSVGASYEFELGFWER